MQKESEVDNMKNTTKRKYQKVVTCAGRDPSSPDPAVLYSVDYPSSFTDTLSRLSTVFYGASLGTLPPLRDPRLRTR